MINNKVRHESSFHNSIRAAGMWRREKSGRRGTREIFWELVRRMGKLFKSGMIQNMVFAFCDLFFSLKRAICAGKNWKFSKSTGAHPPAPRRSYTSALRKRFFPVLFPSRFPRERKREYGNGNDAKKRRSRKSFCLIFTYIKICSCDSFFQLSFLYIINRYVSTKIRQVH